MTSNPPLTPTYILRGHASAIHSLHIFQHNLRLISADADSWIVVWNLVSKRPVAAWKAHEGAILQVRAFCLAEGVQVYSHGRDHKLRVWNIRAQDESILQKTLPVDANGDANVDQGHQPWMVHSLPVNALNFCAFSILFVDGFSLPSGASEKGTDSEGQGRSPSRLDPSTSTSTDPANPTQEIPPNKRSSDRLLAAPNALDSGAIDLFHLPLERRLCTVPPPSSIKPGMVMAVELFADSSRRDLYAASGYEDGHVMVFRSRGVFKDWDPSRDPNKKWAWETLYVSKIHTQPALSIDVPSPGGYVLSSAADALLVKHPVPGWDAGIGGAGAGEPESKPLKTINTKHAGQQGLRVRDDGKIFATAGWDSRVRVYSCKTMKEVAVLKWHKEGCYAVAFATVEDTETVDGSGVQSDSEPGSGSGQLARMDFSLATVHQQRNHKVQRTHWLAAGSKDGKISLWDIY